MGCRWFYPPGGTKTLQYNLGKKKTDSTESCKLNHGYEPCSIPKDAHERVGGPRNNTSNDQIFSTVCVSHL